MTFPSLTFQRFAAHSRMLPASGEKIAASMNQGKGWRLDNWAA